MEVIDLVEKAKKGDKEALIQLVMQKKEEYYRLAYVYTGNKEDSLDALQNMIVILFDNIKKLRDADAFYSWSKTILVNECKRILRERKKEIPIEEKEEGGYFENYQGREMRQDITIYMKRLNIHQQEAIKLRYFLDMDYATIAKMTGTSEGTVKSRIFNGLAKLKGLIGGEY